MYRIVDKKVLNPTVVQLKVEAPLVANKARPGQFIILRVDEEGERIPLTVAGVDKNNGTVKIIYQILGATTEKLSHKEAGDHIQDFVGPLGVATHLDGLKKVCIVGGGCRLTLNADGKKVTKFACVDGPDFNGYEVDFDEAMSRGRMYGAFERHRYEETCNLFSKGVR